ncbi:hypothetical protein ABI027_15245, partial [Enterococcus faecium]
MKKLLGVLCLGMVLAGCSGGTKPPDSSAAQAGGKEAASAPAAGTGPEDEVLNVYNWSDYVEPSVLEE